MKNKEIWEKYTNFTKDLSDNARNLAYAAAGLSWAFKLESGQFPPAVITALRFVIVFFLADMLQYVSGALFVKLWMRFQEKKMFNRTGSIEGEYNQPDWLDYPPFTFWVIKIFSLLVAYLYLGIYVFHGNILPG